ncbi:hypothetical protein Prum_046230 [Phytohabitans rumicis]|uniref:N-acetyltransferase domain-containing protein n=1 Tax=Phytohabitans rumicis TaxID=1076125 RepID=A0A6V8L843_9ACTN|nr:hypothetical protein Prum_046230 [Phytohabitans rumicis]
MDFSIAVLTDADVPAVLALCREALDVPEDAAEAEQIVSRLREQPGVGFVAIADGTLAGVLLGSISHRDSSVGHIDLVAVRPDARRHGIARALVGRAEGALAGKGAAEVLLAGNPPYYAWPGIDVRYTPAICAAIALGYEQDRTAWNMTADLSYEKSPRCAPPRRPRNGWRQPASRYGVRCPTTSTPWPGSRGRTSTTGGPARSRTRWAARARDASSPPAATRCSGSPRTARPARAGSARWAPHPPPRAWASAASCSAAAYASSTRRA